MIRFVDLTEAYWTNGGPPCCAFLDTRTDRFVKHDDGHVFCDVEDFGGVDDMSLAGRCRALVPDGFFDQPGSIARW
jgi:hypothetical protein